MLSSSLWWSPCFAIAAMECGAISMKVCPRSRVAPRHFLPLISLNKPGLLKLAYPLLRATSEEGSSRINGQFENVTGVVTTMEEPSDKQIALVDRDTVSEEVPKEESPFSLGEQFQISALLDRFDIKLNTEDAYSVLIYGSGALIALWLASAVVGAIDSIPVFPKVLEIVGLSYTVWFCSRYLIFKENRDELSVKIDELKKQIVGSSEE